MIGHLGPEIWRSKFSDVFRVGMEQLDHKRPSFTRPATCGQDDDDDEPEKIEEPQPWTRDRDHTRKSCRFEPHTMDR